MSFNKITMVGNLGRDPELRHLPSGISVCNFSLAVNETYRDKTGASRTVPTWFRIAVWGDRAANCAKNLKKGSPVYVAGSLRQRQWKDETGREHSMLEVKASYVRFFGKASSRTVKIK